MNDPAFQIGRRSTKPELPFYTSHYVVAQKLLIFIIISIVGLDNVKQAAISRRQSP